MKNYIVPFVFFLFIFGIPIHRGEAGDGLKVSRPEINNSQAGPTVTSRAELGSEEFLELDFSIDVSASIKDGRFDKVFAESECYFKILETAFNQVQWAVVQSENLRSKIWSVFIRANPVEYTVEGFHLGLLKKVGDGYQLGCKYKSVTIDQEISEAFILSKIGIGKR